MSVRNKPHNGRDRSGHFKVKQADVEDLRADPEGEKYLLDDVRLGGAVADTGMKAGESGKRIGELAAVNRKRAKPASKSRVAKTKVRRKGRSRKR